MTLSVSLLTSNQGANTTVYGNTAANVPANTLLIAVLRHTNQSTSAWANVNSFVDNKGNVWTQKVVGHHNSNAGNESTLEYWWTYVTAAQTGMATTINMSKNVNTYQLDILAVAGCQYPTQPFDTGPLANRVNGGQSSAGSFGTYSTTIRGLSIIAYLQEDQGDPSKLLTAPAGATTLRLHDRLNGLGWIGQISAKYDIVPLTNQALSWTPGGTTSGGTYGVVTIRDEVVYDPDVFTAIADNNSPFIHVFKGLVQEVKLANPATLPAAAGVWVDFTASGLLVVADYSSSTVIRVYDISSGAFVLVTTLNPGQSSVVAKFSPDGKYLAVALNANPGVAVWRVSDWVRLSLNTSPINNYCQGIAWNKQSTRFFTGYPLSSGGNANNGHIFSTEAGNLAQFIGTFPCTQIQAIEVSDDGLHMAVASANGLVLYPLTNSGTTIGTAVAVGAVMALNNVAFNHAKTLIAVVSGATPYLFVYNFSSLTLRTQPAALPSAIARAVAFSVDDSEIIVGGNGVNNYVYDVATMTRQLRSLGVGLSWHIKQARVTAAIIAPAYNQPIINMMQ